MVRDSIFTMDGYATSLQVSHLETLAVGEHILPYTFLVKNLGESISGISLMLPSNPGVWVETSLCSGWNTEICIGIKVPEGITNTIQIGY